MIAEKVSEQVLKASRRVIMNHGNAHSAVVYRKEITRPSPELLGGAMVLSTDDEPEFDYVELGEAKLLFMDGYVESSLSDNTQTYNYAEPSRNVILASVAETGSPEFFIPKKSDIVYYFTILDVAIAYEITKVLGVVEGSPYSTRYEISKRDDLNYIFEE